MLADPQGPDQLRLLVDSVVGSTDTDLFSLFYGSVQEIENLNEAMHFIRDLSNLSESELKDEQTRLTEMLLDLRRKLESQLVSAERSTLPFIDSVDSIIKQEVTGIASLLASLEISTEKLNAFNPYNEEKHHLRILLNKSKQLQDFFDIPVLFSECLSRSFYAEALSLSEFVERTMKHYRLSDIAIFMEMNELLASLKQSLIEAVETSLVNRNLKLQDASDLLLIYRMIFPTADLKLKFLEFRGAFIRKKRASAAQSETSAKRMKEKVECLRVGLSELVNQFKVLFPQSNQQYAGLGEPSLSRLVIGEIEEFLSSLESSLVGLTQDSALETLADIFQLISYLKLFHLNPRVNSISHRYVCARVDKDCRDILESFKLELSNYNWKPFTALIESEEHDPSHIINLTRHKPIAVLYNEVTNILNGVRLFPLISCHQNIVLSLDRAMYSAFELLSSFPSAPSSELSCATRNFCLILIPSIEKYICCIYGFDTRLVQIRAHPRFVQGSINAIQQSELHDKAGHVEASSPSVNLEMMQN